MSRSASRYNASYARRSQRKSTARDRAASVFGHETLHDLGLRQDFLDFARGLPGRRVRRAKAEAAVERTLSNTADQLVLVRWNAVSWRSRYTGTAVRRLLIPCSYRIGHQVERVAE
jgi:hypothetical protein